MLVSLKWRVLRVQPWAPSGRNPRQSKVFTQIAERLGFAFKRLKLRSLGRQGHRGCNSILHQCFKQLIQPFAPGKRRR